MSQTTLPDLSADEAGAPAAVTGDVDAVLLRSSRIQTWLRHYAPAIVIFFGALILWEGFVRVFQIQQFLLPKPSSIAEAFINRWSELAHIGYFTFRNALGGFIIGTSMGVLVAVLIGRWVVAREALLPFAIAANSVPIIAFAPIMNNWFGILNPMSKMSIAAVIVFFPMMINTLRGLTQVDPSKLELMRSYAAGEGRILWQVRFPNALPYMFSALKVCSTLSMIGAVVSEFFGGPRASIGVFITQEAAQFRFANSWAAIVVASILGIAFYLAILLVERLTIPWHASMRND